VGKLLSNDSVANEINATTLILKRAADNLEKLAYNVSAYTAKLSTKGSLANDLITDTVVFNRLRSTVSQLQEVTATSKEVINNLNTSSNTLNNGMNTLNNSLNNKNTPLGMLLNDEKSAANIKVILKNLNSSSQKLDENLEALQHNFLLRGFFRKKAKSDKAVVNVIIDTTL